MSNSNYWFGKDIFDVLGTVDTATLMEVDSFIGKAPSHERADGFVPNAFYADFTPVFHDNNVVYPVYAPWYMGTPIPEAFLRIEDTYSRTAAQAAFSWTGGVLGKQCKPAASMDGLSFDFAFANRSVTVHFPLCEYLASDSAIIVPVADTWRNDAEWGQSAVPTYVEQHTRFLLWCYRYYHENYDDHLVVPEKAYVTRIIGNLPTDVKVYTIFADEQRDQKVAERVFTAFTKAQLEGVPPIHKLNRVPEKPWQEQKEEELADAYRIEDAELHNLAKQYLTSKSERKELEAEDKRLKAKADAIAIALAAQIDGNAGSGKLVDGKTVYRVSHTRSRKSPPQMTAALVYQFAPNHADKVMQESGRKVSVSIDVL